MTCETEGKKKQNDTETIQRLFFGLFSRLFGNGSNQFDETN